MAAREKNLFAEERRERILDTLASDSRVLVNDLSERFGVSSATLRNDLRELEGAGLLRRTHGGAVAMESQAIEHSAEQALSEHEAAKAAIGRAAAAQVHDGEIVLCDSGSTTIEFVRALSGRHGLTIVTNDYTIAAEVERLLSDCTTVLLGGVVRPGFHYTMGFPTIESLSHLSAPVAFIAASAFSFERGFSVHTLDLASFKRTMISRAERRVVLLDSSKFNQFTTVSFADLQDIDEIITDSDIPDDVRARIESMDNGPKLTIAE